MCDTKRFRRIVLIVFEPFARAIEANNEEIPLPVKKVLITIGLGIFLFSVQTAFAQAPQRIQFAKGMNLAVLKGKTRSQGVAYIVKAKAGQKMILNLVPASNITISVQTTLKSEEEGNVLLDGQAGGDYELELPDTCDYKIIIGSDSDQPVPFTLTVEIR